MEIYNLYQGVFKTLRYGTSDVVIDSVTLLFYSLCVALFSWTVFYVFQSLGLYAMAKKQGLKRKAFAFIPFVNIYYMGKITGECRFFSRKVKYVGLYAMLAQICVSVAAFLTIAAQFYLCLVYGEPRYDSATEFGTLLSSPVWDNVTGSLGKLAVWCLNYGELLFIPTFGLIYEVLMLVLLVALYKKYTARWYFPLSILWLFAPLSKTIVVFVLRNRQPIDYEAMMRARREEYIRRQQQYGNPYGNPYGNRYGNPYGNPYGNSYGGQNQPRTPDQNSSSPQQEDPFEEFSSDAGENKQTNDKNSDGFFD